MEARESMQATTWQRLSAAAAGQPASSWRSTYGKMPPLL